MELEKLKQLRESVSKWINAEKKDFGQGLKLLKKAGYKPHVVTKIEEWGANDPRSLRALKMELRNYFKESRKLQQTEAPEPPPPHPEDSENRFIGNVEKELQKEYPAIIKKTLTEFQALYQHRSILHRELKNIGEANDEKSVNERKEKLNIIEPASRRMDMLWGIFEAYKAEGSLPEETFFDEPFDLEKEAATGQPVAGCTEFILPDNLDELKKLKDNLRIKISKAKNRLEYQSEKKEEQPNPMPESPKRAELVKNIEEWEKQKTTVEYRIVELK